MKKIKIYLLTMCLGAFTLTAQQVGEVPEFKTGRAAGNAMEKKMKKAPQKILINDFRINYQILFSDWEGTRAGVYTGKTSAELSVGFEGMEEADFQAITDEVYAQYVDFFQSQGYEIIGADALNGHKAVNKFSSATGGQANYEVMDGYISTTPSGFQFYTNDKARAPLAGRMRGVDAVVVDIRLNIPFIIDSESGASKLASKAVGGISKIVVSPSLRIEDRSNMSYVDPASLATVKAAMKDPMIIDGVFKDEKFKATAAAQTNTAYNIGHLTRVYQTDVNTSKIQVAECDSEKYKKGVSEAATKLLTASAKHFISYTE